MKKIKLLAKIPSDQMILSSIVKGCIWSKLQKNLLLGASSTLYSKWSQDHPDLEKNNYYLKII